MNAEGEVTKVWRELVTRAFKRPGRPQPRPLYTRSMMITPSAAAFLTPRLLFTDVTHIMRIRSGGHAAGALQ
jgi:hypothetical protein